MSLMSIQDAVNIFRAAVELKERSEPARDRQFYSAMARAVHVLQEHGALGHLALKELLADGNEHVRLWAGAQLLSEGDETVVPVLQKIAQSSGLLAFDAEMTLREYDAGRLRSPFPRDLV